MITTIDRSDYRLSLATLANGDTYLLRENSVWDTTERVGSTFTACVGPLRRAAVRDEAGDVRADWLTWAHEVLGNVDPADLEENAAWAHRQPWTILATE